MNRYRHLGLKNVRVQQKQLYHCTSGNPKLCQLNTHAPALSETLNDGPHTSQSSLSLTFLWVSSFCLTCCSTRCETRVGLLRITTPQMLWLYRGAVQGERWNKVSEIMEGRWGCRQNSWPIYWDGTKKKKWFAFFEGVIKMMHSGFK